MSDTTSESDKVKTELASYEQASPIYEQIFALHEIILKTGEVYLIAAGAVWVAVASNQLKIPLEGRMALCALIAIAGIQICIVYRGALRSIRGRFEMIDALGKVAFPTILEIGRGAFTGQGGWASWGKRRKNFFWYMIPITGVVGSMALAWLVLVGRF